MEKLFDINMEDQMLVFTGIKQKIMSIYQTKKEPHYIIGQLEKKNSEYIR